MASVDQSSHHTAQNRWVVNYTQSDVDTIREQIVQTEAVKRRWLILALIVTIAALVGCIALLTTSYALYARGESEKKRLADENAELKAGADQCQQQLSQLTAEQQRASEEKARSQARLDSLLPAVLASRASDGDTASFARMVSGLPYGRLEVASKPPDKLFRNWRLKTEAGTETYTLVGGFVDGKWVIHSNLVARKQD